jgi:tetratricopeptide (TPR) repeat protein
MKRISRLAVVMMAVVAAGCQSPRGGAAPAAAPGAVPTLQQQVAGLDRDLASARQEQQRLVKDIDRLRLDIYETALNLRELKAKADQMVGAIQTNRTSVTALEQAVQRAHANLQEHATSEAAGLRTALEREQQQVARERALAEQRNREVKDLRQALQARDDLLKKAPAAPTPPAAPAPPPAVVVDPPASVRVAAPPAATGSVVKLVTAGNIALRQGNLARATELFQAALAQDPLSLGARLGLAAGAYQAGQLAEARTRIDEVLKENRSNAQALGLRGIVQWREGFLSDALRDCSRAVEIDPQDAMLRKFYGIVLHARKRQDDAIEQMRKAVELDGGDAEAKLNLAILLATARRPLLDEARRYYEEALAAGVARDLALDQLLNPVKPSP